MIKTDDINLTQIESDVAAEARRVSFLKPYDIKTKEPFVVRDLFKNYGKKLVVNNLNFGVQQKECFGFLGLNGAGKTTTLKIITGEINPSKGQAFVNGKEITKPVFFQNDLDLGFCPQFDYLPDFLTVKESLYLFANLRGILPKNTEKIVNEFLGIFKLNEFKNKLTQNLSGGNKRKVSSAIAFIGQPRTVILDEPTSGMDPAAKRYLWNVIKKARDNGTTIILTTHSMEESEALCSKLAIMVNGQFQCFGNIQHLKSKYGKGYSLIIKTKSGDNRDLSDVVRIQNFVANHIPAAVLKDHQDDTLFYQIDTNNEIKINIGELFSLFEQNRNLLNMETYSVSQTTLEQVFLTFAKQQQSNTRKIPVISKQSPTSSFQNNEVTIDL